MNKIAHCSSSSKLYLLTISFVEVIFHYDDFTPIFIISLFSFDDDDDDDDDEEMVLSKSKLFNLEFI